MLVLMNWAPIISDPIELKVGVMDTPEGSRRGLARGLATRPGAGIENARAEAGVADPGRGY